MTLPHETFAQYLRSTPHQDAQAARAELVRVHGYTENKEGFAKGDHLIRWKPEAKGPPPERRAMPKSEIPKPKSRKGGG